MSSLREHLSTTEGHAALAYRPDCPLCRAERQLGRYPGGDPLVPPKLRAGLAAGVLAAGAFAPAGSAVANGPAGEDPAAEVGEGEIPPELQDQFDAISGEHEVGPPPEPGDEPIDTGEEPTDTGEEPIETDEGPLPSELEGTPEPPIEDEGDAGVPVEGRGEAPAPTPPPAPAPPPGGEPPPGAGVKGEEKGDVAEEKPKKRSGGDRGIGVDRGSGIDQTGAPGAQAPAPEAPAAAPHGGYASQGAADDGPSSTGSGSGSGGSDTARGRYHVVQSGECLWTIAEDLLGANASPAEIAAMVDKLWSLNAERIGTGNPSLIHVGDRLVLP